MANVISPLVKTYVATNKKSIRTQKITKVTLHHMAGVMGAKACAEMHVKENVKSSANYYVGKNGDYCCAVPENYRAWTTSSSWNDQRAITIEISNDQTGGNWHIADKVLEATIALVIDICKRNNITKVYFDNTKNAPLTIHKLFAATACPGTYLESLFKSGYVASRINAGLTGVIPTTSTNTSSTTSNSNTNKNPYTMPTSTVKYGSKGSNVGWIQWQLTKIFGYNILIDSSYGPATKNAIMDFQKRNKIAQNKDCNISTINALKNAGSTGANGIKKISLVKDGIDYTSVFDAQFYADNWDDLKAAFGYDSAKLFNHYLTTGYKEFRQASAEFNVQKYAARYADLRNVFGPLTSVNAMKYIQHYITTGKKENRIGI